MSEDIVYNIYDKEEIYTDCTVQVWSNTITGDSSVGWMKNEWISVKDRLPSSYQLVLVWDGEDISINFFDGYGFGFDTIEGEPEVTHWRELPPPPRDNE
jgi:hypothetical protein